MYTNNPTNTIPKTTAALPDTEAKTLATNSNNISILFSYNVNIRILSCEAKYICIYVLRMMGG